MKEERRIRNAKIKENFWISPKLVLAVERLCEKRGIKKSAFYREILINHLKKLAGINEAGS